MKRLKLATCIITALLLLCAFSLYYTYTSTGRLLAQLDQIKIAVKNEDTDGAVVLCKEFKAMWDKEEITLIKFVRHSLLDKITGLTSRLESLAAYGDYAELMAITDELYESIEHILKQEIPSIHSILYVQVV